MCVVTATIKDPSGTPYTLAPVECSFVSNAPAGSNQYYSVDGSPFQTFVNAVTDSFGNLAIVLTGNDTIAPAGSQWSFSVMNSTRTIGFRTIITITGSTQDVSATLQASAAVLPSLFGNATVNTLTATTVNAPTINTNCYVGGSSQFANITAAINAGCHTIHLTNGYTETETADLVIPGLTAIICDGVCTINLNGTNRIVSLGGTTAADGIVIKGMLPLGDHGNGNNAGFIITGYTGTDAAIKIGNSTDATHRTSNVLIEDVGIPLGSAGAGAVAIKLTNTILFTLNRVDVQMGATASSGCYLLDGTGQFTGNGSISNGDCEGSGTNQFGIRGQNVVDGVSIIGGNFVLTNATGTICFDAQNADFFLAYPNCNNAASALNTAVGSGSNGFFTGHLRRDAGVTKVATWGAGTSQSLVYCNTCNFSPDGGNIITNNSTLNNTIIGGTFALSSEKWEIKAGGANSGNFLIEDMANSRFPFGCVPNGECDFMATSANLGSGFRFTAAGNFVIPANGALLMIEGTNPGCAAGQDCIVALATDHAFVGAFNGVQGGHFLLTGNIDAKGIQSKRVAGCATGAAQFNTCDTTVTWTTAFTDANYTATCTGDAATSGVPQIEGISISAAKVGASITVRTIALTAAAAQFTNLDCIAIHD